MNTTKDECDGWINSKSGYKPAHCEPVLVYTRGPSLEIARWSEVSNVWTGPSSDFSDDYVTHWRELPWPPKDAFDKWWRGHRKTDLGSLVITNGNEQFCAGKIIARYIWEAAINSTKQC